MKTRLIALALLLVSLAACSTLPAGSASASQNQRASVRVENQGFADMTVYAARSSERVRLGLVPGHSSAVFDVPAGLVSGLTPLHFIADPIGSARLSVSEEIMVAPGDTVVMTIPPT
jgi:hypothetical protein